MHQVRLLVAIAVLAGGCGGPAAHAPNKTSEPTPASRPAQPSTEAPSSGTAPVTEAPPAAPPKSLTSLEKGEPTLKALAEMVLLGIKEKDPGILRAVLISEREYKELLFPEFPAAGGNVPADFHWQMLEARTLAGIENDLGKFGGEDFELVEVFPTQGVQDYKTFKIHNKVEVRVRKRSSAEVQQLKLFGSVVERDGQLKILSYRN